MTARCFFSILTAAAILCGCSEPDETVMGSTSDGMYELTLSADPNWVRPQATLPVRVNVLRRGRPSTPGFGDQVTLTANNGNVSPSFLSVTFTTDEADTSLARYSAFANFRAGSASEEAQAEIIGIFKDAKATLKLRIVPLVSD